MKRQTYIAPATEVQKIELQRLMAASGPQNVYSDSKDGISDESLILSRGSSWDDED